MPPERKQKAKDTKDQEERILAAIAAIKNGELSSIREAVRKYGVPSTTLRNRMSGVTCRSQKRANCHKLTAEEEDSLLKWILSEAEQHGTPPSRSHIEDRANGILAARGTTPAQKVGGSWVYNYIKRQEKLNPIYTRRRYSRRIYNAVVGSASANTGLPSANASPRTGQPGNQDSIPPEIPDSHLSHLDLRSLDSCRKLEKLLSTFKELEAKESHAQSSTTDLTIDNIIKGCEMMVEGAYGLLKYALDLRTALEKARREETPPGGE